MSNFKTPQLKLDFTADVTSIITACGAAHQKTGNLEGEVSMSHLIDCLREGYMTGGGRAWSAPREGGNAVGGRAWSNPRLGGFGVTVEDLLREAGFKIRYQRNGRATRTYVSLNV